MYGDEDSAIHEGAHSVIAAVLGCKVSLVTVEPGTAKTGCVWWSGPKATAKMPPAEMPMIAWAGSWQRVVQRNVAVAIAGDAAESLFLPRAGGRVALSLGEQVADRLAEVVTLPAPTLAERREAAKGVNTAGLSDDEHIAAMVRTACRGDVTRAGPWFAWIQAETLSLLRQQEAAVRALARLLLERGTLGREAARKALREVMTDG